MGRRNSGASRSTADIALPNRVGIPLPLEPSTGTSKHLEELGLEVAEVVAVVYVNGVEVRRC